MHFFWQPFFSSSFTCITCHDGVLNINKFIFLFFCQKKGFPKLEKIFSNYLISQYAINFQNLRKIIPKITLPMYFLEHFYKNKKKKCLMWLLKFFLDPIYKFYFHDTCIFLQRKALKLHFMSEKKCNIFHIIYVCIHQLL